jgi:hypothetical protein
VKIVMGWNFFAERLRRRRYPLRKEGKDMSTLDGHLLLLLGHT